MRFTFLLIVLAMATLFVGCNTRSSKTKADCAATESKNLLYTAKSWEAVTDLLGSSFTPATMVVKDSLMEVDFTLKKKEGTEIVFIELVCALNKDLGSYTGLTISYKCETPLVVKLSQSDFGKDGDESYAHYQYIVPASETISTSTLTFADFMQPQWTPEASKGKAMKLENVNAIYLTPDIDAAVGGSSKLGVKGMFLHKATK